MSIKSKIIVPLLAAVLVLPVGAFAEAPHPIKTSEENHHHGQHMNQKYLQEIATKFSLTEKEKELQALAAEREGLRNQMKELKQSPKWKEYKETKHKEFEGKYKPQLDEINKKLAAGTITKEEAQAQKYALMGKDKNFAAKWQETKALHEQLKADVAKNDKAAVDQTLQKIIAQQKEQNQHFQKKIDELKVQLSK